LGGPYAAFLVFDLQISGFIISLQGRPPPRPRPNRLAVRSIKSKLRFAEYFCEYSSSVISRARIEPIESATREGVRPGSAGKHVRVIKKFRIPNKTRCPILSPLENHNPAQRMRQSSISARTMITMMNAAKSAVKNFIIIGRFEPAVTYFFNSSFSAWLSTIRKPLAVWRSE